MNNNEEKRKLNIALLLFLASVDPKANVATICTGMVASLGPVLHCAGEKGEQSALSNSRMMVHQPLEYGMVDQILTNNNKAYNAYEKEDYHRDYFGSDFYMPFISPDR